MNFPEILTVTALEYETRTPVQGVALILMLFAVRKNNYDVGPFITDVKGQVRIARRDCEWHIRNSQELFIMDYIDSLEQCKPKFEIRLHLPEHVEGMIRQYHSAPDLWGQAFPNPDQLFLALENVKNRAFEPASVMISDQEVVRNPEVTIYLRRRSNESTSRLQTA